MLDMSVYIWCCSSRALREVPLQVMSERNAEAQATGQADADRNYVAVSVAANVDQVYLNVQVSAAAVPGRTHSAC